MYDNHLTYDERHCDGGAKHGHVLLEAEEESEIPRRHFLNRVDQAIGILTRSI